MPAKMVAAHRQNADTAAMPAAVPPPSSMRAPLSHPLSRPFRSDIERMFSEEALDRMAKAIVREEAKTGRIKDLPPEASTTWLGLRRT